MISNKKKMFVSEQIFKISAVFCAKRMIIGHCDVINLKKAFDRFFFIFKHPHMEQHKSISKRVSHIQAQTHTYLHIHCV